MKKFFAATLAVAGLGIGTAAVAAINPLGVAGAQTSTPAPAETARPIDSVLSGLVADGTLTQSQADAVKSGLTTFRKEHKPIRNAAKDSVSLAATAIGIDVKDLVKELRTGKSIADVATEHGVAESTVAEAIVKDLSSKIDAAAANGTITAERAKTIEAKLPAKVTQLVEKTRGQHATATTTTTAG
jgi:uncharacterized protein YidB (DUF937 family)